MTDEEFQKLKEKEAFEAAMEEEHSVTFKKKELIVIFNVLTRSQFSYGDMLAIMPIVQKIEPIVAVASNIPTNHKNEPKLAGVKKEIN